MTEAIRPEVLVRPRGDPTGRHTVFLCIDTEFHNRLISELGFAALDTAALGQSPAGWRAEKWFSLIQTSRFVLKDAHHSKNVQRHCRFGRTQIVNMANLKRHIEVLFERWHKADRDIVLVGHALPGDLANIRFTLGHSMTSFPGVVATLDTFDIVRKAKGTSNDLKSVYERLSRETAWGYHNAGNDAVYTLRTLLMLATTPSHQWTTSEVEKTHLKQIITRTLSVLVLLPSKFFGRFVGWLRRANGQESQQPDKKQSYKRNGSSLHKKRPTWRQLSKHQTWGHEEVEKNGPMQPVVLRWYKSSLQWLLSKVS